MYHLLGSLSKNNDNNGEKLNKYLELAEEIKKMWRQDRVNGAPCHVCDWCHPKDAP